MFFSFSVFVLLVVCASPMYASSFWCHSFFFRPCHNNNLSVICHILPLSRLWEFILGFCFVLLSAVIVAWVFISWSPFWSCLVVDLAIEKKKCFFFSFRICVHSFNSQTGLIGNILKWGQGVALICGPFYEMWCTIQFIWIWFSRGY